MYIYILIYQTYILWCPFLTIYFSTGDLSVISPSGLSPVPSLISLCKTHTCQLPRKQSSNPIRAYYLFIYLFARQVLCHCATAPDLENGGFTIQSLKKRPREKLFILSVSCMAFHPHIRGYQHMGWFPPYLPCSSKGNWRVTSPAGCESEYLLSLSLGDAVPLVRHFITMEHDQHINGTDFSL